MAPYRLKQSRYLKALKLKALNVDVCEGCGINKPSDGSHRVPRSWCVGDYEWLYWEPTNIDLLCRGCHDKMPNGIHSKLFMELKNSYEILRYIEGVHPLYFRKIKMRYDI